MTREIDDGKQQIPDLTGELLLVVFGSRSRDLLGFFANFGNHRRRFAPIESDLRGFDLQFERATEGREADRHSIERTAMNRPGAAQGRTLFSSFCRLDARPNTRDLMLRDLLRFPEYVWMSPQQFGGDRLHDIAEGKCTFLLGHAGMKHHLQKKISKLIAQIVEVAARDRVGNLVGLFESIWRDCFERLRQIPWTTMVRGAQHSHDFNQGADVARTAHRLARPCRPARTKRSKPAGARFA